MDHPTNTILIGDDPRLTTYIPIGKKVYSQCIKKQQTVGRKAFGTVLVVANTISQKVYIMGWQRSPYVICTIRPVAKDQYQSHPIRVVDIDTKKKKWKLADDQTVLGPMVDYRKGKNTYTWRGPDSRYYGFPIYGTSIWKPQIYRNRNIWATAPANAKVHGVGTRTVEGVQWLVVVASTATGVFVYRKVDDGNTSDVMYDQSAAPNGWIEVGEIPYLDFNAVSIPGTVVFPWLFSPDGSKAVSTAEMYYSGTINGTPKDERVTVSEMLSFTAQDGWDFELLFLNAEKEYVPSAGFIPTHMDVQETVSETIDTTSYTGTVRITDINGTATNKRLGPVDFDINGAIVLVEEITVTSYQYYSVYNISFSATHEQRSNITSDITTTLCGKVFQQQQSIANAFSLGDELTYADYVYNTTTNGSRVDIKTYDLRDNFVCLSRRTYTTFFEQYLQWFGKGYNRYLMNSRSSEQSTYEYTVYSNIEKKYSEILPPTNIDLPPKKTAIEEKGWVEPSPYPQTFGPYIDSTIQSLSYPRKIRYLVGQYLSDTVSFSRDGLYIASVFLAETGAWHFRSYPSNAFDIVPLIPGDFPRYHLVGPI